LADGAVRRQRQWRRRLLGRLFAATARRWLGIAVHDTQCGFKLFDGEVARRLFADVRESRFLVDLELLLLARQAGYRVAEVAIDWHEVPGGHLRPIAELPRIVAGLWRLRRQFGCERVVSQVAKAADV
jgi:dolichyl-phosphate beta-glucosyltransferase